MTKFDLLKFFADLLYSLGILHAYEVHFEGLMPNSLTVHWFLGGYSVWKTW